MTCKKCGKELKDDAKFCNICGTPVYDDKPAQLQQPVQTVQKQKKKFQISSGLWVWLVTIISLFCLLPITLIIGKIAMKFM